MKRFNFLLVSFAAARAGVTQRSPWGRGALRDSGPSGCEGVSQQKKAG